MKNRYLFIICLFLSSWQYVFCQYDPPIIIYYGLNESHSKNWAQIAKNGMVGLTYFQRYENSIDEGALIYEAIYPDGSKNNETVTTGRRLEISVLLFDSLSNPHIFVASSSDTDQTIDHFSKNSNGQWQKEAIINFMNEGGKYIYELTAEKGPNDSFHLLVLKAQTNPDTIYGFDAACVNNYLYHLTNASGVWIKELIRVYDMVYTYDMYIKQLTRQDMKIDKEGFVHLVYGEQINSADYNHSASRLCYATNKSGNWVIETASMYDIDTRDDAGWFPSLCLNQDGVPYVSCMYVKRYSTGSAIYCNLLLIHRVANDNWQREIVATGDDGYYGPDGRRYTGALSHLVFDKTNNPRIVFSDIASAHWNFNTLNVGNVRYGVKENGIWKITTIYQQPLPTSFVNAAEMHGMCLLLSETNDLVRVIGQELIINGRYNYSSKLVYLTPNKVNAINETIMPRYDLKQNYPNPFNPTTKIRFSLPESAFTRLTIYDALGREVVTLKNEEINAGYHEVEFDAGNLASGIYFYRISTPKFTSTKKLILMK